MGSPPTVARRATLRLCVVSAECSRRVPFKQVRSQWRRRTWLRCAPLSLTRWVPPLPLAPRKRMLTPPPHTETRRSRKGSKQFFAEMQEEGRRQNAKATRARAKWNKGQMHRKRRTEGACKKEALEMVFFSHAHKRFQFLELILLLGTQLLVRTGGSCGSCAVTCHHHLPLPTCWSS